MTGRVVAELSCANPEGVKMQGKGKKYGHISSGVRARATVASAATIALAASFATVVLPSPTALAQVEQGGQATTRVDKNVLSLNWLTGTFTGTWRGNSITFAPPAGENFPKDPEWPASFAETASAEFIPGNDALGIKSIRRDGESLVVEFDREIEVKSGQGVMVKVGVPDGFKFALGGKGVWGVLGTTIQEEPLQKDPPFHRRG